MNIRPASQCTAPLQADGIHPQERVDVGGRRGTSQCPVGHHATPVFRPGLECVWTGRKLVGDFHVDHAIHRLPSREIVRRRSERIVENWRNLSREFPSRFVNAAAKLSGGASRYGTGKVSTGRGRGRGRDRACPWVGEAASFKFCRGHRIDGSHERHGAGGAVRSASPLSPPWAVSPWSRAPRGTCRPGSSRVPSSSAWRRCCGTAGGASWSTRKRAPVPEAACESVLDGSLEEPLASC